MDALPDSKEGTHRSLVKHTTSLMMAEPLLLLFQNLFSVLNNQQTLDLLHVTTPVSSGMHKLIAPASSLLYFETQNQEPTEFVPSYRQTRSKENKRNKQKTQKHMKEDASTTSTLRLHILSHPTGFMLEAVVFCVTVQFCPGEGSFPAK